MKRYMTAPTNFTPIDTLPKELLGHLLSFAIGTTETELDEANDNRLLYASYDVLYVASLVSRKWHQALSWVKLSQRAFDDFDLVTHTFLQMPHTERTGKDHSCCQCDEILYDAVRFKRTKVLDWLLRQKMLVTCDMPGIYLDVYNTAARYDTFVKLYQQAGSKMENLSLMNEILVQSIGTGTRTRNQIAEFICNRKREMPGPAYDPDPIRRQLVCSYTPSTDAGYLSDQERPWNQPGYVSVYSPASERKPKESGYSYY
jgi:hypothetical protein